jgi:hypothetical protein
MPSTGLTVEFWIRDESPMGGGEPERLLFLYGDAKPALWMSQTTTGLRVGRCDSFLDIPHFLATGQWMHVAVAFNADGSSNLFLDGLPAASGTLSMVNCSLTTSNFQLGTGELSKLANINSKH